MGMYDVFNYVIYTAPATAYNILDYTVQSVGLKPKKVEAIKLSAPEPLWKIARLTGPFYLLAAVSGVTAISLGMYASSENFLKTKSSEEKEIFHTALHHHLVHSLVFFALPMCHRPILTGTCITAGIVFYCGTHYHDVITKKQEYNDLRKMLNKIGSICFIIGWISTIL